MESQRRGNAPSAKVECFISVFPIDFRNAHSKCSRPPFSPPSLPPRNRSRSTYTDHGREKHERSESVTDGVIKFLQRAIMLLWQDFIPPVRFLLPSVFANMRAMIKILSSKISANYIDGFIYFINNVHLIISSCVINSFPHVNFTTDFSIAIHCTKCPQ